MALLLCIGVGQKAWGQCTINYALYDSYGDGWNGASISVINLSSNAEITTLTLSSGSSTSGSFSVPAGAIIIFQWNSGSWDGETSYTITANGQTILDGDGGDEFPLIWSCPGSGGTTNCSLCYIFQDSYGDGWNGAAIKVWDANTNTLLATWTLSSGSFTYGALPLNSNTNVIFTWTSGSYDDETSYTIYGTDGEIILSNNSGNGFPVEYSVCPSCSAPRNLTATATEHDATVTWAAGNSESSWILEYSTESDFSTFATETLNSTSYSFTCLPTGATYYVRVKADCGGGDESNWTTTNFTTTGAVTCQTVGTGTNSATTYGPVNDYWNYGFRQIIYPASSIQTDGTISAISFQYAYSSPMSAKNNVNIYMGHTSQSSFSTGTDWIPVSSMQLVYSGSLNCSQGWNTFTLNNPFDYNGTDNLVVTIQDNSGDYDGSSYTFYYSSASGNVQLYLYNDDSPYSASNPGSGSVTTYYPNTQFCFLSSSCPKPHDLTATPDKHSADISWTEAGDANAWQICLNGDENNLIDVTTTSHTLTGLDAETQYNVKVRSVCGDCDMSTWTSIDFTTLVSCPTPTDLEVSNVGPHTADVNWEGNANMYQIRYAINGASFSDDFENGLANWTLIDADGDGYPWMSLSNLDNYTTYYSSITIEAQSGTDAALSGSYINGINALTPDNYLISPEVTLGGTLTFYARSLDADYPEHFGIAVSTSTNTSTSDFTTIQEWDTEYDTEWHPYTVDLSSYSGQGYIAFRDFNAYDQYIVMIDDVTLTAPPSEWIETVDVIGDSYTLSNLIPETPYVVEVRAICGGEDGESHWISETFTTPPACFQPEVTVSNVTGGSAEISWTGNAESYLLTYSTNGDIVDADYDATSPYILCNLEAGTTYEIQVQGNCGTEGLSRWGNAQFTTASTPVTFSAGAITEDIYVPCGDFTGSQTIGSDEVTVEVPITEPVTIGDGTTTYYYYPINMYFNYSVTQELYTPAEIGSACTINSVSFYYDYSSSFSCSGVQMYMKHVNKTSFDNNTDMVQVYPSEKVWEGTMSASTAGWVTITLDEPFEYDGTSNLLLCMYDPTSGYPGSSYKFRTTTKDYYCGIHWYSDSYTPNINDLTSFSGSKSYTQYRVNTQFGISGTGTATQIGSATGNEVEYQWKVDNEPIAGANGENYIITGAEMEALTPSLHTYTRWAKDLCNDWTQSEGEFTLDLRVPGTPQLTEMPSGLLCGDQATLNVTSENSSNMQLMYFWYNEYPTPNSIVIAHSDEQYTTNPLALGTNTLYVQAVSYRVENDIDTVWQCFSEPTEVILEASSFEAAAIAEIEPNYCGNYFTLQIEGNPAPNHTYVWYSDNDCTREVGRGYSYTLEERQTATATYYLREYAWELEGGSYLCQSSNTGSVAVTVIPLEAPYIENESYEFCKGEALNIEALGEAYDEQGLLKPYIVWFADNDDDAWIDTTASGSPLSRQIAETSTTLYAATASYIDSYSGPMTLSSPAASQTNYGNAVYFDLTAGNSPVVLDSINLQVVSGQGTGIQEQVYYYLGSLDIAATTEPSSWSLLNTTMDYDGGDRATIHFSDPIRLEPNETISLLINTSNAMQLYYNVETQIQPGDVLANNNFMTMRKGYGFQYTSDFQEGFPISAPDARSFCGTVHFDVEGELHFGCMSQYRTPVTVLVDSLPQVGTFDDPDPLCNGDNLSQEALEELLPEISWNTHSDDPDSRIEVWMVSADDEEPELLTDDMVFYYGNDYTLIRRATNNCGSAQSAAHITVYAPPAFTEEADIPEEICANTPIELDMPMSDETGTDEETWWEYTGVEEEDYQELDTESGIPAIGQYYIRARIENTCGSSATDPVLVEVRDLPAIAPVEVTEIATCFGQAISPEAPEVEYNLSQGTATWVLVQDDLTADPVELTFPQTADMSWDGVRICYAATNDCGTTYADTITLTVHPDIALTVTSDFEQNGLEFICPAVGAELTAAAADGINITSYVWTSLDEEGGLVETEGNPVHARRGSVDVEHFYQVIATDEFGCRDTAATAVAIVFHDVLTYDTVEICENELPYTYGDAYSDTTLQRPGTHIVYLTQPNGCDNAVSLTLNVREYDIIDFHYGLCGEGDSYTWQFEDYEPRTYTGSARDTIRISYTSAPCDSLLLCITVTQGEPYLVVTDPQLSGTAGETLSTTVFGRTDCENAMKVAIEYDIYKDGELVNPDDYGRLNLTTAIPDLNLQFGRDVHAASGSIPANTFNMYNYQYGYFYLNFFAYAPNTVTATWNEPGEYKIVFRVVGRTGGMDYPYQSTPGVVIGGGGGSTTSVYATDSLIMYVSAEGGNEGQESDVNNGQNGMITISAVQDNPVIGATSTFAVNVENPGETDPKTKVALDYEVYRDGQLLNTLDGYGTMSFATFYDVTNSMVGRTLEFPDGSVPEASFRVGFYSYGYFTLGFWAQTRNEFTASWQQPGEYKVVFRLVERTGGTPYPLTYGDNPNDTIGGGNGNSTANVLDTNAVIFYIPVAEPAEAVLDTTVCENDLPVMIHGTEFSDDAQEDLHVYSDNGVYDTIYHLTLTVAPAYTAENPVELDSVVCAGAFPFEWNGVTFEEDGEMTQTATLQTVLGCDSVVSMTVTVDQPAHAAYTETACGSYEWNGTLYTESGDYEYSYENDYGCTVTDTLHLTVHDVTTTPEVVAVCGSYEWNGETYYESGTYTYEHEVEYDNDVCTVTDTLVLTVNTPLGTADTVETCGSYEWNGETYTASGTYYFDYEDADLNAGECEHVDTLYLTIFEVTPLVETETGCNEFYWQAADQTYYESGTYTYDRENEFGCTVTDTLHLTISQPNGEVITVEACESYEWHDRPYTESGEYYYDYQDADVNGGACPHVDTLRLTISQPYGEVFTVEVCGEYTWIDGEEPITQSGTYTHETLEEGETCPRIDTLVLTVNPVYEVTDELVISVTELPYTYADDTTFELGTQSGEFTVHLLSTSGCDSVVTLTLTVSGGSEGDAFLTVENISDSEFEIVAFANQVDPTEKVAIAYSITKDGEPVNIISHDCGGELNIATEFNGSFVGQNVSYGEGYIPGSTFRLSSHYHDYFYFHFLNGRANRISHSFTEEGEYEITLTLMSRDGGTDIFVPYSTAGGIMLIGGEGSADGEALATETITFSVSGGGSNEPANPAPMGIGDGGQMPDITLFPNPARDIVTLRTNVADADCTVTDMSGKVVLSATADQASDLQINVSQWAAGVYFVNLRSNGSTVTKKLVITK